MNRQILGVALLVLAFSASASADFERGMQAYQEGDYTTAFNEIKAAAENGDERAYGKLGAFYLYGSGTPRSLTEAYAWFSVADDWGDQFAERYLDTVAGSMTRAELEQAEALAESYRAAHPKPEVAE